MTTHHVLIAGRVQGVGYRDWLVAQARRRGLHGWVRNRSDGRVEALLHGDEAALAELLRLCANGPPLARVTEIAHTPAEPPTQTGFHRLPTE